MFGHSKHYSLVGLIIVCIAGFLLLGIKPSQSQEGEPEQIIDQPINGFNLYLPIIGKHDLHLKSLAIQFAPVLKFDQAAGTFPMDAQKWWEEMLCGNSGGPPPAGYQACRLHTDGWGTSTINDIWLGNPVFSTLVADNFQIPTYYKARRDATTNQVRIEYWWFYGWQPECIGSQGWHASDWEHIMVILTQDETEIAAVVYYQHAGWYLKHHGRIPLEGSRPIIYVGKIAHGSYHDSTGIGGIGSCLYYEDWRNPSASSVWHTSDTPLISLDSSQQAWLDYDRTGNFYWGWNASGLTIGTHPTKHTPDLFNRLACEGKDLIGTEGCQGGYSDCKVNHTWCWTYVCTPHASGFYCPIDTYNKDFLIPNTNSGLFP